MKIICFTVFFLFAIQTIADEGISTESSAKATPGDSDRIFAWHLFKQQFINLQGAEAWGFHEEERALKRRGFDGCILGVFIRHLQLWDAYVSSTLNSLEKSGATKASLAASEQALTKQADQAKAHYFKVVHQLVVSVSETPDALALERRARNLSITIEKYTEDPAKIVTRIEMQSINQAVSGIERGLQNLPRLTTEQLQAEVAALPPEEPHR